MERRVDAVLSEGAADDHVFHVLPCFRERACLMHVASDDCLSLLLQRACSELGHEWEELFGSEFEVCLSECSTLRYDGCGKVELAAALSAVEDFGLKLWKQGGCRVPERSPFLRFGHVPGDVDREWDGPAQQLSNVIW
jgi:hypothetical protein